jgi:hypothetical protein
MSTGEVDEFESAVVEAMVKAGVKSQIIYAFRRTGLIASEDNWERLTEAQRRDWEAALAEYERQTRSVQ